MSVTVAKANLTDAINKHAAAKAAFDANNTDTKLQQEFAAATAAVQTTQAEYIASLESADPLTQNIEDRIGKARKEEKEKLHARLEKEKQDRLEAEKQAKELSDRITAMEAANAAATDKKSTEEGTAEVKALEEKLNAVINKTRQEIESKENAASSRIAALEKELELKELDGYKQRKIAEAGDTLISELVTGASKEDIDNSIITAKQAYARVVKRIEGAGATAIQDAERTLPRTPNPTMSLAGLTGSLTAAQIKAMSPAEWSKHRNQLGFK